MSRPLRRYATHLRPRRPLRRLAGLTAFAGALLLVATTAATASVGAQTARTCTVPKYPGSGYFTSLSVKRTGCATGRKVALAHHRCRTRSGRAGRCSQRVRGYRCRERRTSIPTEINARVTCRRGAKTVIHTYQQNT